MHAYLKTAMSNNDQMHQSQLYIMAYRSDKAQLNYMTRTKLCKCLEDLGGFAISPQNLMTIFCVLFVLEHVKHYSIFHLAPYTDF